MINIPIWVFILLIVLAALPFTFIIVGIIASYIIGAIEERKRIKKFEESEKCPYEIEEK